MAKANKHDTTISVGETDPDVEVAFDVQLMLQIERLDELKAFLSEAQTDAFNQLSPIQLNNKLETLNTVWTEFRSNHQFLASSYPHQFISSDYLSSKTNVTALTVFTDAKSAFQSRLAVLAPAQMSSVERHTQVRSKWVDAPKVPPFSGEQKDWKVFEDMFQALITNDKTLQDVEKLYHLKAAVKGDPYELISSIPTVGNQFETAWKLLVDRYDNRRILVFQQLERLMGTNSPIVNTAPAHRALLNTVKHACDALRTLEQDVEAWATPLLYATLRRLPASTRLEWERKLGFSSDIPKFSEFLKFLENEICAVESFATLSPRTTISQSSARGSRSATAPSSSSARVFSTTAQRSEYPTDSLSSSSITDSIPAASPSARGYRGADDPGHLCDYCGSAHFIVSCTSFRNLTPHERYQAVRQQELCFNCLGRHRVRSCKYQSSCRAQGCQRRHHTLIHEEAMDRTSTTSQGTAVPPRSGSVFQATPAQAATASRLLAATQGPVQQLALAPTSRSDLPDCSDHQAQDVLARSVTLSISRTRSLLDTLNAQHDLAHSSPRPVASAELLRTPSSLLATCQALLEPSDCTAQPVRMLINSGSELSLITDRLAHRFRLSRQRSSTSLVGIGTVHTVRSKGVSTIKLRSLHSFEYIHVTVNILSKLTTPLPAFDVDSSSWNHLDGLQLADRDYLKPGSIDIVLGSIPFSQIIPPCIKRAHIPAPIALLTIFGWIIFGPTTKSASSSTTALHTVVKYDLHELLTKFWVQEESWSSAVPLSPEDDECESHFAATHSRDSSGRYVVLLPLKQPGHLLGDSILKAQHCLRSQLKRLGSDAHYQTLYTDFMTEYETLGHMRPAPSSCTEPQPVYYLPHHGVLREHSVTTKLRVVFNGSAPTGSGYSLNDVLHTGAKLHKDIFDVLLWMRQHRVVFAADITKMFRQIKVHPADWDLQRNVWVDDQSQVVPYQLTTVTYGTRCAPFLAVRVLLQLVQDEGHKYPLAVEPLTNGCYVDAIYGGSNSVEQARAVAQDLIKLCAAGGFPLAKWCSNHKELLIQLSPSSTLSDTAHILDDSPTKVLGLAWHPISDCFQFTPKSSCVKLVTKRSILSEVAQLFDPLGFLAPVIIRAKILIQELWLLKVGWDDELPTPIAQRWAALREELTGISQVRVPRWLHTHLRANVQIHGFSDASQLAMAACVYLRVVTPAQEIITSFVCAKTKVAPLKHMTISRRELTAAHMVSKLVCHVQRLLQLTNEPVYLWTDSLVALTWIQSHPSRWKEFVRNRVTNIQEMTAKARWQYVPSKQNPADCASRGLAPDKLSTFLLWWNGPLWFQSSLEE